MYYSMYNIYEFKKKIKIMYAIVKQTVKSIDYFQI